MKLKLVLNFKDLADETKDDSVIKKVDSSNGILFKQGEEEKQ